MYTKRSLAHILGSDFSGTGDYPAIIISTLRGFRKVMLPASLCIWALIITFGVFWMCGVISVMYVIGGISLFFLLTISLIMKHTSIILAVVHHLKYREKYHYLLKRCFDSLQSEGVTGMVLARLLVEAIKTV